MSTACIMVMIASAGIVMVFTPLDMHDRPVMAAITSMVIGSITVVMAITAMLYVWKVNMLCDSCGGERDSKAKK